jgi:pimeloyl-ACP methyl ester carboxylesterase
MRRWVLLRGLARESGHWGAFAQALARATGDQVLALDLPGNGTRFSERSPASVADLVEDCRHRLAPSPAVTVVVAMSLGAMVALDWGRRAPHELAGCILVNTSAGGASPFWRRLQPRTYPTIARSLWPCTAIAAREAAVLRMTSNVQAHGGIVGQWTALAQAHPVSAPNALRQLWAAARYRAPRQRPPVPLLLLASSADRLVHPSCSARLADRWQVPLHVHPWAGHDLPLDDPTWVLDQVVASGFGGGRAPEVP